MLSDVVPLLRCPHCAAGLHLDGAALRCASGHAFDVARQGHVTLARGGGRGRTGDSAAMVAARQAVLDAGHFAPVLDAVGATVAEGVADGTTEDGTGATRALVDVGAGTGHYLAAALSRLPAHVGLALDASTYAARRAARAHPRAGSVVCDASQPWPVRDGVADAVLDVFAPRNGPEIARVLRPGGLLVVVTPSEDHLAELVEPLGLLGLDPAKRARLGETLSPYVTPVGERAVRARPTLDHDAVAAVVGMGPSAWHLAPEALRTAVGRLPAQVAVTVSVTVAMFRRP